ncbi:hypothetical protein [Herbaspirillum chlorophenolicum]|uniref:hypothetical protein n=1 Tax=Herbaspirillum chlorophenolicum TaxID=211589 RepID=UPI00067BE635|nr:hypothetical protein [Herbaspirillum chlorophenolicum]
MTLIFTKTFANVALQTSDRLVTWKTKEKNIIPFDRRANKTIIFKAADGIAVIGFAGAAFINNVPTDEWLAEVLYGRRLPRDEDGRIAPFRSDDGVRLHHLKALELIRFIRNAVANIHLANFQGYGLEISIAGVYERKKKLLNFQAHLNRTVRGRKVSVEKAVELKSETLCYSIGSTLGIDLLERGGPPSLGMCWTDMIQATKKTARKESTVGADVLGVILWASKENQAFKFHAEAEFFSENQNKIPLPSYVPTGSYPTSITPWFVSPHNAIPPQHLTGNFRQVDGNTEIVFIGAKGQDGLAFMFSSVKRPPNIAP